ncbi:hypothetical protein D9758_016207 [Tetrapyrgos nigripes]|uniref:DUF659 domain-containing protein n=1 Tax=Tetrapyrgos nigripes TaxID=182062 RepID=A0A8H5FNZ6_9AGAR|nr:hypothetical protein D9758_016207 [Tetrapyrgos nigripes]
MSVSTNPLWAFFHKGERKNSTQHETWCKACVKHYQDLGAHTLEESIRNEDEATKYQRREQAFIDACTMAGALRGEKTVFITHILGKRRSKTCQPCPYASEEAREEAQRQRDSENNSASSKPKTTATKRKISELDKNDMEPSQDTSSSEHKKLKQPKLRVFNALDMPFSKTEAEVVKAQALRAVVSSKSKEGLFEDPEMLKLIKLLRKDAMDIMPTARQIGGRLLDEAAAKVEVKLEDLLKGEDLGIATDQWKNIRKESIAGVCVNVNYTSYTVELSEVTAMNKDGEAQCAEFERLVDTIERRFECTVIYLVTDADGGSKKGRMVLGKRRPYLVLPSCWAHQFQLQLGDYFKVYEFGALIAEEATFLIGWINSHGKVRKIFDAAQEWIAKDQNIQRIVILSYLIANLTRWTTQYVAFFRLRDLKAPLQLAVMQSRNAILTAQVGAAKSTEKDRLEAEANRACDLIADGRNRLYSFWAGLETVIGDIEPICYGTNINQKDSTRPDQVLLTIAGIYLHFVDHPEPELSVTMVERIEKRWKDCDQPVFLAALILNPFEGLSAFGPRAGLNHFNVTNMIVWLYRRINLRPDNTDTAEDRKIKEKSVSSAMFQYLATTGPFKDFQSAREDFEGTMGQDPIAAWKGLSGTAEIRELAFFAIKIFKIVVNSAGCERLFSDTKFRQSPRRNRLGLKKLQKLHMVGADIRMSNQEQSLIKPRGKRQNHKQESINKLLSVPRYRDLLEDMNDEDETERGRALISTAAGWRTEMAKWIGEARRAESDEANEEVVDHDLPDDYSRLPRLQAVFESLPQINEEAILMEALADAEEDEIPDDGAIEIPSDEEYIE